MSSRFYFGDDSIPSSQTPTNYSDGDIDDDEEKEEEEEEDDDDTTTLPFPKPLSRPRFLAADFEPHAFLSSLSTSNRFQTLEDLQSELRELSSAINKELVDLVNENYAEFVALGADLGGGEEKVEEVRVGVLGFEKDVVGLRERVVQRREEVSGLVGVKREVRREIGVGRGLLEVDERLAELEVRVGVKERVGGVVDEVDEEDGVKWSEDWDEESVSESDEEYDEGDGVPGRIRALAEKYLVVKLLVQKYGANHPFLVAQRERIQRVQDRVRLEVETAARGADETAVKQKLIQLRVQMDE